MIPDAEQMIKELLAAGWKPWRGHRTVWVAPDGNEMFRGPYGAWAAMKGLLR